MKLRIKGNSIRLRLSMSDIDTFGKEGYLEERTEIGTAVFIYALLRSDEATMNATLDNNKIFVHLPATQATEWVTTEKVGYDARVNLPTGNELYLLVEKDFKCLDETEEDQSDNFDNPLLAKK
jgi:hypothetical protein